MRRLFPARPAQEPGDAGFTLIEMLVVVSIIGILAAVAIPRYMAYANSSKAAEVSNVAGAIVAAMAGYADAQGLNADAAVSYFTGATLNPENPSTTKELTVLMPSFTPPANSKFFYTVYPIKATTGAQTNEAVYCIQAAVRMPASGTTPLVAGMPAFGVVVYSSSPTSASGWDGRVNLKFFAATGAVPTITGLTPGGYCSATGTAAGTYS